MHRQIRFTSRSPSATPLAADKRVSRTIAVLATSLLFISAATQAQDALEPYTEPIEGTTIELEIVPIPAGTFDIPDPLDPDATKTINIGPLWIAKTEITWDLYDVFVYKLDHPQETQPGETDAITRPSKPYISMDRGFGHADYPAISMSYKGASQFCTWLSEKTGHTYRLPTEAEWEYVCRAGSDKTYAFGESPDELDKYAWYKANSEHKTHEVGTKSPSPWGVHDMHGNASEWCTGLNGKPITRGGSYTDTPEKLTCESRLPPTWQWNASDPQIPQSEWWLADCTFVGFRIIRVPSEEKDNLEN